MKTHRGVSLSVRVGYLKKNIINLLNIELNPGEIKLLPGGIKHIRGKRPGCFDKYLSKISSIISKPDYIGSNPKYPNSVEYIKKIEENVLVAIRLNNKKSILCVATMYPITDSKIKRMVIKNRIIKL